MSTSNVVVTETKDGDAFVVRDKPRSKRAHDELEAQIVVSVADVGLRRALARGIREAIEAAAAARTPVPRPRVVRLRTRRRLDALGPAAIEGALVVVRVTAENARRLPALVEAVRAAGPLGVQMVWDGEDPPRPLVEQHVFLVLEKARATPAGPPVVLARSNEPSIALRLTTAHVADRGPGKGVPS